MLKAPQRTKQDIITPDVIQPSIIDAGAQVARAVQDVGQIVSGVGAVEAQVNAIDEKRRVALAKKLEAEQEADDRAAATNAATVSKGALNEKMVDIKSREQLNAKGSTAEYDAYSNEVVSKGAAQLANEYQQELYMSDMLVTNTNNRKTSLTHEGEQKKVANKAAASASADISVQTAIASFDNPNVHDAEEDNIEAQADSMQAESGWTKEERDQWEAKKKSVMFEGIVRQWNIKDPAIAKLSLDTNRENIDPKQLPALDTLVSEGQTNQKGKNLSEEIITKTDDFEEQKRLAKKHGNADVSDNALARINADQDDKVAKEKKDKELYRDDMFGKIHDLSRLPDAGLTQMLDMANGATDGKDRADFDKYARARFKDVNGEPRDGDINTYATLLDDIDDGKYSKISELTPFYADLSIAQFNKAVSSLENKRQEVKTGKKATGEVIKYSNAKAAFQNVFKLQTYNAEEQGASFSAILQLLESQGKDLSVGEAENVIRQHLIDNGGQVGTVPDTILGIPAGTKVITYEEALEAGDEVSEFIPNTLVLPKINETDSGKEFRDIRSAFIDLGFRDKIPEVMARLYKKRYIDGVPLSFFEQQQFDNGLATLERREK